MNVGSYIFSQVVDYIPRYQFDKLVAKYHGNWHSKDLTCYNQLLHLLFGQITGCGSLRDICLCLEAHKPILYHLGFRNTVTQPSLSRANENRDYRIYEGLGTYLISIVRPLYSKTAIPEITVDNVLYALDSTTISTSIKLATWALGKYSKGGVKMLYFEYLYLTRFYRIRCCMDIKSAKMIPNQQNRQKSAWIFGLSGFFDYLCKLSVNDDFN